MIYWHKSLQITNYCFCLVTMEQFGSPDVTNAADAIISDVPREMGNIRQAKKKRRSILKVPMNPSSERQALKVG